tara:strand:+ start:1304 stop:1672 length:369 start_codon:yes stop_codon:yes gene_type:complete
MNDVEATIEFSTKELKHIFNALALSLNKTEEGIKNNYQLNIHNNTHILEKNLGELNDLKKKILPNYEDVKTKLKLKLKGNDIELNGVKIARFFDITGTVLDNFQEMISRANGEVTKKGVNHE